MKNIKIEKANAQWSDIHFATSLVSEVSRYSCNVILKSISENNINQQVDLKSILGTTALMSNNSNYLEIELSGENEDLEYVMLLTFLEKYPN